ncbi:hypothetical protein PV08_04347 [Exophiala spinifera]|uniref:Dienelactone hydrolase domain-containing protein n=1 Tax=Exophiala spinifera TaxID=91928 RepID=A0A0D1YPM4_9EURO|nr:uncharacterized protein PV08_04347 [Exophiala spinifera]KIW17156.1 hypothetical protein PV08_04347 [Exophiala spinifera]
MASGPIQACCVQGFKYDGTPIGHIEPSFVNTQFGPVDAYIAEPTVDGEKHGILFIPDVIGHSSTNAQLLADQFAARGYHVVIPDLFYGDAIEASNFYNIDLSKWQLGHYSDRKLAHDPASIDPIIEGCIKKMKTEFGIKRLGAVGYCFGAKYVVRFLKEGSFDVGYSAHPSFVDAEELAAITKPFSISAAENDDIFTVAGRHQSETILKQAGVPWQIALYGGVSHGFAVRGDMKDKKQRFAIESAFSQAVDWLKFHLDD